MRAWDGERLQELTCMVSILHGHGYMLISIWVLIVFYTTIDIVYVQDACELRKRLLIHLLTYRENHYVCNIPEVLQDYLRRYISLTMEEHELI